MTTPQFSFWMHGDIVNMQNRLKAALDGTNQSVAACTNLDTATASSWASFYSAGVSWTSESANWINTGSQATQGQAIEQELVAWQERLAGQCTLSTPIYVPTTMNTTASLVIGWGIVGGSALLSAWAFNLASQHLLAHKAAAAPAKRLRRRSKRRRARRLAHA